VSASKRRSTGSNLAGGKVFLNQLVFFMTHKSPGSLGSEIRGPSDYHIKIYLSETPDVNKSTSEAGECLPVW
jgi:hypothetical protein